MTSQDKYGFAQELGERRGCGTKPLIIVSLGRTHSREAIKRKQVGPSTVVHGSAMLRA